MKTIIVSLIDRLAQFAVKSPDTIPTTIDIFDTFFVHVGKVIEVILAPPPTPPLRFLPLKTYPVGPGHFFLFFIFKKKRVVRAV